MTRWIPWWLCACGPTTPDAPPTGAEPPSQETDVADSDPPDETDAVPDPPDPPTGPTSWGAGFVDLTRALSAEDRFEVFLGSAESWQSPQVSVGLIADLDDDGRAEWIAASSPAGVGPAGLALRVFQVDWTTGQLTRDAALEARLDTDPTRSLYGAVDVDSDGRVDLLTMDRPTGVALRRGDAYVRPDLPVESTGTLGPVYAVSPMDIDEDGWLDLMVGQAPTCQGRSVDLYFATGAGLYAPGGDRVAAGGGEAWVDALLPLPGTTAGPTPGVFAVALSCDQADPFPGFYEFQRRPGASYPEVVPVDPLPANPYWVATPAGWGAKVTQVSPMGASLEDLTGDGVGELLVTIDYVALFDRASGAWVDRTHEAGLTLPPRAPQYYIPWSVVHPDLDMDGRADVLVTYGDDATSYFTERGAPHPTVAWRNAGDLRFEDVSAPLHLPTDGGWRGAVLSDPDCDGDADLALGGMGVEPRLLRNDIDVGRRGLSLRLRGTTSNHLGIGAVVKVDVDDLPTRTMVMGAVGNPFGAAAPELFAGLGDAGVARRITVQWPSGTRQVLPDVAGGRCLTVEEPPVLAIQPASRRAPADGASTIELHVTPRAEDGVLRSGIPIAVHVDGAPVVVEGPVASPDGQRFVLRAPDAPGASVVTVTIDGVEIGVRPRLWWDEAH